MTRWRIALVIGLVLATTPRAEAFCGFYIEGSGQQLAADATQVVLMRKGTRTVLSMQNNYKGPASDFAMVIPVPVVLKEGDVKTLSKQAFANVERMGAPRLVEYWEQDPCSPEVDTKVESSRAYDRPVLKKKAAEPTGVTIEAQFAVGEYQIVILSAKDSTGLDTWLRREKYAIPRGAEPLLRPYVESGSKFFVAKVDVKKVRFQDGRVDLSPLRFHYDSDQFVLPIRLGLANSSGTQDLIVSILAPNQRYEVANYKNVTIPTNLTVRDAVRDRFATFYAALFDRTIEQNPGAVVTEYAWQASSCDPCPGPQLTYGDFATLGADVLESQVASPQQPPSAPGARRRVPMAGNDFVLTRLHTRYGKDIKDDLVFRAAQPIVGGREFMAANGKLEEGAKPSPNINNFQARYIIRHRWTGAVACSHPRRGMWGGPPGSGGMPQTSPALNLAFAARSGLQLATSIDGNVPEIGLVNGKLAPIPKR